MPQIKFQPRISAAPISPLRSPLLPTFLPLGFCNEHQKRSLDCQVVHDSRLLSIVRSEWNRMEKLVSLAYRWFVLFGNIFIWLILFHLFIYLFIYRMYIWISPSFFLWHRKYSCNVINFLSKKGIICKIFFGRAIFFLRFFIDIFFMLKIWIYLNRTLKELWKDVIKLLW